MCKGEEYEVCAFRTFGHTSLLACRKLELEHVVRYMWCTSIWRRMMCWATDRRGTRVRNYSEGHDERADRDEGLQDLEGPGNSSAPEGRQPYVDSHAMPDRLADLLAISCWLSLQHAAEVISISPSRQRPGSQAELTHRLRRRRRRRKKDSGSVIFHFTRLLQAPSEWVTGQFPVPVNQSEWTPGFPGQRALEQRRCRQLASTPGSGGDLGDVRIRSTHDGGR